MKIQQSVKLCRYHALDLIVIDSMSCDVDVIKEPRATPAVHIRLECISKILPQFKNSSYVQGDLPNIPNDRSASRGINVTQSDLAYIIATYLNKSISEMIFFNVMDYLVVVVL